MIQTISNVRHFEHYFMELGILIRTMEETKGNRESHSVLLITFLVAQCLREPDQDIMMSAEGTGMTISAISYHFGGERGREMEVLGTVYVLWMGSFPKLHCNFVT